jgi:hypothetical protein
MLSEKPRVGKLWRVVRASAVALSLALGAAMSAPAQEPPPARSQDGTALQRGGRNEVPQRPVKRTPRIRQARRQQRREATQQGTTSVQAGATRQRVRHARIKLRGAKSQRRPLRVQEGVGPRARVRHRRHSPEKATAMARQPGRK